MKGILINFLLIFYASFCYAQESSNEISFTNSLNWQSILAKAKAEQKMIFIDCYASWCKPCKWMDKNVFNKQDVISLINSNFISIKLKMDNADDIKPDNQTALLKLVDSIQSIKNLPTYLFFDKTGTLVHGYGGSMKPETFIEVVKDSRVQDSQYFTLLGKLRENKVSISRYMYLAEVGKSIGDMKMSDSLGMVYVNQIMLKKETQQITKSEIVFSSELCNNSNQPIFNFIYSNAFYIDSFMNDDHYTERIIDKVINVEFFASEFEKAANYKSEPNWKAITNQLNKKFSPTIVDRNVINNQIFWYDKSGNRKKYVTAIIRHVTALKHDNDDPIYYNNQAFEVFKYSNSKEQLKSALAWVDRSLAIAENSPAFILDTKANILYKLGDRQNALAIQQEAITKDKENKEIQANFKKMSQGLPTW